MTRVLALWYGLFPALFNLVFAGLLGFWAWRGAPFVARAGAVSDTLWASFLIPFIAWFAIAPGVEFWVRLGDFPPRVSPAKSPAARFALLPGWVRALSFGCAGLALVGAPACLALARLAPEALSLPAFLGWKMGFAALVSGLLVPAIAWVSLTCEPGMAKAVPRFPVLDLPASLDFYEKRLGFKKLFELEGYAGVGRADLELHLFAMTDPNLPKWTSCRVNVRGVDELYAEYLRAGVIHPNGALANQPWGFREFTVLDLSGNAIVFGQRLG